MIKKFKKEDLVVVNKSFSKLISSSGDVLIALGDMEKKDPDYSEMISSIKTNPSRINDLISELPPKEATTILGVIMKLGLVINRYKDEALTADDKIRLGNELKGIAVELSELNEQ
ncbi:MAG: hypothetical protein J7K00_01920 [Candidatus Diapherotrites archaeon]|nr:hypothetical protein [Candidatus Diapherotrites archaeon]